MNFKWGASLCSLNPDGLPATKNSFTLIICDNGNVCSFWPWQKKKSISKIYHIWSIEHTRLMKLCSRASHDSWTCSSPPAFWQSSLFTQPHWSHGCHPNRHVNLRITFTPEQDPRDLNSAAWGYALLPSQSGLCWLSCRRFWGADPRHSCCRQTVRVPDAKRSLIFWHQWQHPEVVKCSFHASAPTNPSNKNEKGSVLIEANSRHIRIHLVQLLKVGHLPLTLATNPTRIVPLIPAGPIKVSSLRRMYRGSKILQPQGEDQPNSWSASQHQQIFTTYDCLYPIPPPQLVFIEQVFPQSPAHIGSNEIITKLILARL